MNSRSFRYAVVAATLVCLAGCTQDTSNEQEVRLPTPVVAQQERYTVKRRDDLHKIGEKLNTGWEAILLVNEQLLKEKYDETCGELSQTYRTRSGRRGLFCNDQYNRPYGNTLLPGWKLIIPETTAPKEIEQAVRSVAGKKIAIVIDDTGSMEDDRQRVGEFYLAAVKRYSKSIAGVYLYADGEVRQFKAGSVEFRTTGNRENSHHALKEAMSSNPDAIVLVTDEAGDDWSWSTVSDLPPVIAHCLPSEGGIYECEENLRRLAKETKGSYITGAEEPVVAAR